VLITKDVVGEAKEACGCEVGRPSDAGSSFWGLQRYGLNLTEPSPRHSNEVPLLFVFFLVFHVYLAVSFNQHSNHTWHRAETAAALVVKTVICRGRHRPRG
jgi:hypothetical protein